MNIARIKQAIINALDTCGQGSDEEWQLQSALCAMDSRRPVPIAIVPGTPAWDKADAEETIAKLKAVYSETSQLLFAVIRTVGSVTVPKGTLLGLDGRDTIDRDDGVDGITLRYDRTPEAT